MPCYHPLKGFRGKGQGRPVAFTMSAACQEMILLPCGQCIGCRLDKAKDWAFRCMAEATLHRDNMFLTLTYNEGNLPYGGTLVPDHLKNFWKRLRKAIAPARIRYYACGEYGEKLSRPHYHAIVFGLWPEDASFQKEHRGHRYFTSALIDRAWQGRGFHFFSTVNYKTAGYVARYVCKKQTGDPDRVAAHYFHELPDGNQIFRHPEFSRMSLKPGIGANYFAAFNREIYPPDAVVVDGKLQKPPRYFDKLLQDEDEFAFELVKSARADRGRENFENNTPKRLAVREKVHKARISSLQRDLER